MTGGAGKPAAVDVVRRLLAAQDAGHLDEALTLADPAIVIRPLTRPGRSVYHGHAGLLDLLDNAGRTVGDHRVEWGELSESAPGTVTAVSTVWLATDGGERAIARIRNEFVVHDGLVTEYDSYLAD